MVYEDIRKSKCIALHDEKDLIIGHLISEGRYCLHKKGTLQIQGHEVNVMVKLLRGKLAPDIKLYHDPTIPSTNKIIESSHSNILSILLFLDKVLL